MKKLNRKVLLSIFSIISFFIIVGIFIYNYQTYTKEYDNIYRCRRNSSINNGER